MMDETLHPDPASFRDPGARVYLRGDRVFRELSPKGEEAWKELNASGLLSNFIEKGLLIRTWEPGDPPRFSGGKVIEHARVPFLSYPYEWPYPFLHRAAALHLDLLEELVPRGFILKDATPFNVQFVGAGAVFIDVPSIEKRAEGDPWTAYGQFCETMLYPLMISAYKKIPFQPLLQGQPNGIPMETAARFFEWSDVWRKGVFRHVKIPQVLSRAFRGEDVSREEIKKTGMPASAILKNVQELKRILGALARRPAPVSHWTNYADQNSYDEKTTAAKKTFVDRVLAREKPDLTWDVGCNTGVFSEIALQHSSLVVALDGDEASVEKLANKAIAERQTKLLPLVLQWAAPSPALGWNGAERKHFFDRANPDMILYLGLIHHVAVRDHVPIDMQLELLSRVAKKAVLVEYVDRADPLFQRLARNVDNSFAGYSIDGFTRAAARFFDAADSQEITPTRKIFFLRKRT